ncbi:hypothetical protein PAHAL_4G162500 [Panicum hallii]|uniref:Uncharacterized protein n=1 Tax=Panicum hallii TaxID=206008 RepID=A0A2T8JD35_9POAL|nr:hypothetical protein PAHAL_4G162500 [Panicum hallii]
MQQPHVPPCSSANEGRATRAEAGGTRPRHEASGARRPGGPRENGRSQRKGAYPRRRLPLRSLRLLPSTSATCYPPPAKEQQCPRRRHWNAHMMKQASSASPSRLPARPPTPPSAPASALAGGAAIGRCPIAARRNASKASYSLTQHWNQTSSA